MALVEDLDVFFSVDEFAVTATLDDGQTMPVIFDRAHIEAITGGAGVDGTQPIALARQADVIDRNLNIEDGLLIPQVGDVSASNAARSGDARFILRGLQPDGTGLTVLILEAC